MDELQKFSTLGGGGKLFGRVAKNCDGGVVQRFDAIWRTITYGRIISINVKHT